MGSIVGQATGSAGNLFGSALGLASGAGQNSSVAGPTLQNLLPQIQTANQDVQGNIQNQNAFAQALQNQSNGGGPNLAATQLANATGQNVANQAALMASQRGTGSNAGLIARQAAQQGAGIQQNAAGQAAQIAAQQQLNAQGQLANVYNNIGAESGQNLATNQNALLGQNNAALNAETLNSQIAQNNSTTKLNQLSGIGSGLALSGASSGGGTSGGGGSSGGSGSGSGGGGSADLSGSSSLSMPDLGSSFLKASGGLIQLDNKLGQVNPVSTGSSQSGSSDSSDMSDLSDAAMFAAKGGSVKFSSELHPHLEEVAKIYHPHMNGYNSASNAYAKGGKVDALVSPGERFLKPKDVKKVAYGKADPMKIGEKIPGKAKVPGAVDSYENDTVPKKLDEGGIVIPRHITQGKNPGKDASAFVMAIISKQKKGAK